MLNIHLSLSCYTLLSDPSILVSKRILLGSFRSRFDLLEVFHEDESEAHIMTHTTVPFEVTLRLSSQIKTIQHFLSVSSSSNTCQLKYVCCLLVAWQCGTQKLVFGTIITDPEHWCLRLKWLDYYGIIAQQTPYNSHNAKGAWFVLVFDVIRLIETEYPLPWNGRSVKHYSSASTLKWVVTCFMAMVRISGGALGK